MKNHLIAGLMAATMFSAPVQAQQLSGSAQATIDATFSEATAEAPALSVIVRRHGRTVYERHAGWASWS